jgi:hypothetical protein
MLKAKYPVKHDILLKNIVSGETMRVDIINEKDIDGKQFWVISSNKRQVLLAKASYTVVKR